MFPDALEAAIRKIVKPDQPITARHAAVLLGVHINTLKRIPPDQLPYFRVGTRGDRRYHMRDVKAYMNRRTENGA
jgi:hypothetical protein